MPVICMLSVFFFFVSECHSISENTVSGKGDDDEGSGKNIVHETKNGISEADKLDDVSKIDSSNHIVRLYYHPSQAASRSVLRLLKLYGMEKFTELIAKQHLKGNTVVPSLELIQENLKLTDFVSIKKYLQQSSPAAGEKLVLYTLVNCHFSERVLFFLTKECKDCGVIVKNDQNTPDIRKELGRKSGGRVQFPSLTISPNGGVIFESLDIIETLKELFLGKIPAHNIERGVAAEAAFNTGLKPFAVVAVVNHAEYPVLMKWLSSTKRNEMVAVETFLENEYTNDISDGGAHPPVLLSIKHSEGYSPNKTVVATGVHEMKMYFAIAEYLLELEKARAEFGDENAKKIVLEKFSIYSSSSCHACLILKNQLQKNGLDHLVKVVYLDDETVLKEFEKIGGVTIPSLALKDKILLDTAKDIFEFIKKVNESPL